MHNHVSVGAPYDFNKPVTCPDCINELNAKADKWEADLSVKHKLPAGFWDSHVRMWDK